MFKEKIVARPWESNPRLLWQFSPENVRSYRRYKLCKNKVQKRIRQQQNKQIHEHPKNERGSNSLSLNNGSGKVVVQRRGQMLCRAVLAALAVTCTFSSETLAHGQGTRHLVQAKDIICVLLLSGVQKDDLDANTLRKLRRHNVNIDDIDDKLRQECFPSTVENVKSVTTVTQYTSSESLASKNESNSSIKNVKLNENLEALISDFINHKQMVLTALTNLKLNTVKDVQEKNSNEKNTFDIVTERIESKYTTANNKQDDLDSLFKMFKTYKLKNPTNKNDISTTENNLILSGRIQKESTITIKEQNDIERLFRAWQTFTQTTHKINYISTTEVYLAESEKVSKNCSAVNKKDQNYLNNPFKMWQTFNMENGISTTEQHLSSFKKTTEGETYLSDKVQNYLDRLFRLWKTNTLTKHEEHNISANKEGRNVKINSNSNKISVKETNEKRQKKDISKTNILLLDTDNINKILTSYIAKQQKTNDVMSSIVTPKYDMMTISDILSRSDLNNFYISLQKQNFKPLVNTVSKTNSKQISETEKQLVQETKGIFAPKYEYDYKNYITEKYVRPILFSYDNAVGMFESRTTPSTVAVHNIHEIKSNNSNQLAIFAPVMLKELIENVKTIVLSDIIKEMSTVKTTTDKGAYDTTKIIEKIMQVTKEIKTKNSSNIATTKKSLSVTDKSHVQQSYALFDDTVYPPPFMNPNKLKQPEKNIAESAPNHFETQHGNVIYPFKNSVVRNIHTASIIQTNSQEIPPLAISISKPSRLINQNIIVKTMQPIINKNLPRTGYLKDWSYILDYNKKSKANNHINTRYTKEKTHSYLKDKPKTSRFMKDSINNYRSREYTSKNNYEIDNHRSHYDTNTITQLRYTDKNGYHNTLEKNNDRSRYNYQPVYRLTSREQRPLTDLQKTSMYDDTHFKNFLKTQQKVNEMLERILATKTITRDIVEIP